MAPPKVYLFDEIAKHKKTEDCCPNISGKETCSPSSKCAGKGKQKQLAED
ncbi:hypothetical protein POPTR_018G105200v4 [Populus trichocarpa]|uniref:Uncharacterized protein n=1 Tax=Populus trichocarpa TaxID=3694 RepID=A0A2K1WYY7_POPTR|nr:hypothetical protein BDE02_18G090000 [Populus trichocarpa]PNS93744.1 hypothetical protein POPTR_018G105200v4 [Populus trichocarpa]